MEFRAQSHSNIVGNVSAPTLNCLCLLYLYFYSTCTCITITGCATFDWYFYELLCVSEKNSMLVMVEFQPVTLKLECNALSTGPKSQFGTNQY